MPRVSLIWKAKDTPLAPCDLVSLSTKSRILSGKPKPLGTRHAWVYTLMKRGSGIFHTPQGETRIKPMDLLIIDPECLRAWSSSTSQSSTCRTTLFRWRSTPAFKRLIPPEGGFLLLSLSPKTCRNIADLHRKIMTEVYSPDEFSPDAISNFHRDLDLLLVRAATPKTDDEISVVRFNAAVKWLERKPTAKYAVKALCQHLEISTMTLHRLFMLHTGQSPNHFVQNVKMKHASKLLLSRKHTIKEIAHQLGYKHPSDFSRAYKTVTGKAARSVAGPRRLINP